MTFMLGTHQVQFMATPGTEHITWFVSDTRLEDRAEMPDCRGETCIDSGGFMRIKKHGRWPFGAAPYVRRVRRLRDRIGRRLRWAAPQDWMCEPQQLAKTEKTIAEHQDLTIDSVVELRSMAPEIHWIPVLQGQSEDDYMRHLDQYAERGIDLTAERVVGLGSVCRRQGTVEFVSIVRRLAACGLRLHGFGVKTLGLAQVADLLVSSDSMAWSIEARWLQRPGLEQCVGGTHKNCANCLPYALDWRRRLLEKLPPSWAQTLPPWNEWVCSDCGIDRPDARRCQSCNSVRVVSVRFLVHHFGSDWRSLIGSSLPPQQLSFPPEFHALPAVA